MAGTFRSQRPPALEAASHDDLFGGSRFDATRGRWGVGSGEDGAAAKESPSVAGAADDPHGFASHEDFAVTVHDQGLLPPRISFHPSTPPRSGGLASAGSPPSGSSAATTSDATLSASRRGHHRSASGSLLKFRPPPMLSSPSEGQGAGMVLPWTVADAARSLATSASTSSSSSLPTSLPTASQSGLASSLSSWLSVSAPSADAARAHDSWARTCSPRVLVLFVVLIAITASLSMLIGLSRQGRRYGVVTAVTTSGAYTYDPASVVAVGEVIKLAVSFGAVALGGQWGDVRSVFLEDRWGVLWFGLTSVLYFLQNNFVFLAMSTVDPSAYQLTLNTRILYTGLLTQWMMGKQLLPSQWLATLVLLLGVISTQMSLERGFHAVLRSPLPGLLWTQAVAALSAFSGVLNQFALHRSARFSLHAQNALMYTFGTVLNLGAFLSHAWRSADTDGSLHAFRLSLALSAGGGSIPSESWSSALDPAATAATSLSSAGAENVSSSASGVLASGAGSGSAASLGPMSLGESIVVLGWLFETRFFRGWDALVVLIALLFGVSGLLVSAIVKATNSVVKQNATAVALGVVVFLSRVLFGSPLSFEKLAGTAAVLWGTVTYFSVESIHTITTPRNLALSLLVLVACWLVGEHDPNGSHPWER